LLHIPVVPSPPTIDRDRDRPPIAPPNPTPYQPPKPPITMLSGILVFNQKGENLIFRAFRNDCRPRLADVFRIQVISNAQVRSPILTLGSTTFSHVKHENIYLVAITKSNANAALVFEFLYRLIQLGRGYFGKFDEEAVKNNFVLVYELLDGMDVNQLPEFPSRLGFL
jgi:AP-2 complex subunit mu-1